MNEMELGPAFDYHFASHLMGKVKPDIDAFDYVVNALAVPASKILFFDDNELNVEAAQQVGMNAIRVVGFDQLQHAFNTYDISY
jgi:putative hydrolase of the HAD superfamily